MSLWFRRKDKKGRTPLYAVPFAPFVLVALVGMVFAMLLPIVQALRAWIGE
jgi:hypothetical protein